MGRMLKLFTGQIAFLVGVLFLPNEAMSQPISSLPAAKSPGTPMPAQLLRQMTDFYRKANSFQVDFIRVDTIVDQGGKHTLEWKQEVAFQRPNLIAIRSVVPSGAQSAGSIEYLSDGRFLYVSDRHLAQYLKRPGIRSLDELLDRGKVPSPTYALLELFSESPYDRLITPGRYRAKIPPAAPFGSAAAIDAQLSHGLSTQPGVLKYVGEEVVNGARAHHLRIERWNEDIDLWIAIVGDPVLQRALFDGKKGESLIRVFDEQARRSNIRKLKREISDLESHMEQARDKKVQETLRSQLNGSRELLEAIQLEANKPVAKLAIEHRYKNWQIDRPLARDIFVFKSEGLTEMRDSFEVPADKPSK